MTNLQPVDFKAVAAKGAFVYCYLREDGSPYYVGIADGHRWKRPFEKHVVFVPYTTPERVRVMRSGLSYEEAKQWEIFYIARFGRKDIGTGVLRNRTDGGEGNLNPSKDTRHAVGSARRGVKMLDSTKQLISKASRSQQNKNTEAMIAVNAVRMAKPEERARLSEIQKEYCDNEEVREFKSTNALRQWQNPEVATKQAAAIKAGKVNAGALQAFQKYGILPEVWKQLTKPQKDHAPKWLPIAEFMGLTLLEYAALARPEKLRAAASFRAA